ncbi:restriction endonuclease subunit S [Ahrensia kielensis]|uniref:restriction endonuclease subunit S n=1 Tax=Ahrensia kielensis TaxID=76980 RepID=UPI000371996E|nr:restriction endonuclease subunit S [Ahrensia kielensis]
MSKWPIVALGEVCGLQNGFAFKSKLFCSAGTPILRISNIQSGGIKDTNLVFANPADYREDLSRFKIEFGDLLIAMSGATTGKIGFNQQKKTFLLNQRVGKFEPTANLDKKYLYHFLETKVADNLEISSGVAQPNLSADQIRKMQIPLPPLDEQKRIAAILDKADALRRKRRDALALLDTLTQSIFIDMFGDPITNPKKLVRRPLSELIRVSSGEGLTSNEMLGGKFPVYGGNGINGWHNQGEHPAGTVVIGRVGVYCGAVHVTDRKSWITDNALVVKKKQDIETEYLADALKLANLNQYAGRAAQPLVSGNRIYPVEILVPDEAEQRKYSELKKNLKSRSQKIVHHLTQLDTLFASLQSRAFSGEL